MNKIKVRFAPSPTGNLHVGNLRTALVNFLYARRHAGVFMLRIDDTDNLRSTAAYEASIRDDLMWMGMPWDCEARQSERLSSYDQALQKLQDLGRAYPCYETQEELGLKRKAQRIAGRPPVYDRAALKLTKDDIARYQAEGRRPHYRFLLNHEMVIWNDLVRGDIRYHMSSLSDPVLMREDGRVIYTLASVVDDCEDHITTILRGEDHVTNSAAQIQLFEALGAAPPTFGHLALLAGADGEGLSKRLGSLSIGQLRKDAMLAPALASLLSAIGTSSPLIAHSSLDELIKEFDIGNFGRATAKFSMTELEQVNARIIQQMPFATAAPELAENGYEQIDEAFWLAVRGNLATIIGAGRWWDICQGDVTPEMIDEQVTMAAADLLSKDPLGEGSWSEWTKLVAQKTGKKGKALYRPLRLAITGEESGPDVGGLLTYIGHEKIIKRLQGKTA